MSGLDGLGWPNPEDEPKQNKTMNSQLEIKLATKMTDEQINQRIAEACGWKMSTETVEHTDGYQWTETRKFWVSPTGKRDNIPDYLNDLNAMRSATNHQSVDFQEEFDTALRSLNGLIHQVTSTQWAEIFIDIALREGIIKQ